MTEQATAKPNYKSTLNLPKTDFAMKANLSQNEPQSQKRWEQGHLYEEIIKARESAGVPNFNFHDGPPYANGSIHVGHLLNKVLKDIVVRTHLMAGQQCRYIPGWDCHGLPIEHKVMTELLAPGSGKAEKLNTLTDDQRRMAIRRECAKSAEKFIKLQAGQMKRLLTLADYDHPYTTMQPEYERGVVEVFAELLERGLVFRALKAVHWSIDNQTALAEAELEYYDREDPAVFVDFEALDREAVQRAFGGVELEQNPSFMIWTTTPWTLPANVGVAIHEKYKYALVKIDGNVTVIASELVPKVTRIAKAESVEVLAETEGKNLVGLRYRHPFVTNVPACGLGRPCDPNKVWSIVAAPYVTLEDGTGLVHTAPGHGSDDYNTGIREELPIYCPVEKDGTFDATVPEWILGKKVFDANPIIVNHLRDSGHLFHHHAITHSYPHDWRGKGPVIFRATEQWFISVDQPFSREPKASAASLRDLALSATERDVRFVPDWGRNRMRGMLESRPDWCISRQRAWGLPIPAFSTRDGAVIMTPGSVRAVAERFGKAGSDAWFTETPEQLLQAWDPTSDHDLPESMRRSLDKSTLSKMYDIFDVWFESGSSWNAVLRQRNLGYPADLYLEGSDQHRGWFQLSLLPALGATGQSPFKALLTHGFMVDKDGKKMSKSLGNTLEVDDLLKNYGADVLRWWVSSLAFENDIKVDLSFFETAGESYRKVRNTLRFLLSNLYDFDPAKDRVKASAISPTSIDGYILQEAANLQKFVIEAYEQYEFRKAHLAIFDFCNDTLSAFYCAAVKDRLYCDRADSLRRRTTQTMMWDLVEMLCRLLAPLIPHSADETYRALWKDDARSVHLQTHGDVNLNFSADADWPQVLAAREGAQKALEEAKPRGIENPLDAEVVLPDVDDVLVKFKTDLPDMLGVSRVRLDRGASAVTINDLRNEPRCERSWKRDVTVKQRADGGMLSDRDAEAVGMDR